MQGNNCSLLFVKMIPLLLMPVLAKAEWNASYFVGEVLLKHYERMIRPVADQSQPVNLRVSIGIKNIVTLDIKKQQFSTFGWFNIYWHDAFLTWDVKKAPIDLLLIHPGTIWHPDMVIMNTVTDLSQLTDHKMKLSVTPKGMIKWSPGGLFKTSCSIDITRYPFDTQTCTISLASWSSTKQYVNGTFHDPAFEVSDMQDHPEWTLVDTEAVFETSGSNFTYLYFNFTLRRKVIFYVFNVVLPLVLLSFLNCLVFLLPVDSGEKMTASVTMFVSFAVFISFINTSLPQNSDTLCLFNLYVAVQMLLSVCSTVMAAVIVLIFDKDGDPPSPSRETLRASFKAADHCPSRRPSSVFGESTQASSISFDTVCAYTEREPAVANGSPRPDSPMEGNANSLYVSQGGKKHGKEDLVVSSKFFGRRCFSVKTAWHLISVKNLTPRERRLLSYTLDKIGFVFTLCANFFSLVVFFSLMVFG